MTELLVITGLSGAGRSSAADVLEDRGWFVIDNLPTSLIPKVAELASAPASTATRVALAVGGGSEPDVLLQELAAVRDLGIRVRVLFLEASTEILVRRYERTRRRHPRSVDLGRLSDAIEEERAALRPVREAADVVVDTTELNVHQFRERLVELIGDHGADLGMRTTVVSFGYGQGLPTDVDLVFDCRFLPNPHWDDRLRPFTGLDAPVRDFVLGQPAAMQFVDQVDALLALLLPQYEAEGKSYLTVAFGCTGGRHRSVAIAEEVAARLRARGASPAVRHRDVAR
ncbi:MAG: RNase adapter RapZ [Actinobacteria bacterium]|nr:RNase adapter RapZ [Actinomycetota bacterium]